MWGWAATVAALFAASCGFPRPPPLGDSGNDNDDAAPGTVPCQLTAIEPVIARSDDIVTIEGTFADSVMVNFPGGSSMAATLLGPHRARVSVPAAATAGDLTVTTCGSMLGPVPFRRSSFMLGVGTFASNFEQASGARQYPLLAAPREGHTSAVIGQQVYLVGGLGRDGPLNSVEHALLNADGTLGRFTMIPGIALVTPRQAHTSAVIADQLYVVGGFGNGSLSSVEHATIAPDGSLGPFTLSSVLLATARQGHAMVVIGNYLYVLGGRATTPLNSVERAPVRADGTVGSFSIVPEVALVTARQGHTATVIGSFLYIVGGSGNNGPLMSVERAMINGDGSLGPFTAASVAMLSTARAGHSAAMVGGYLYVFGGVGDGGSLKLVERAPIASDGSLGGFEVVPGAAMTRARHGHTTIAAGNYLYTLGGSDDVGRLERGEHASLSATGMLSKFTIAPGSPLATARAHCAGVAVGGTFYIVGGVSGQTTVEKAAVNPDGTLGPFAAVSGITLAEGRDGHVVAVIGRYLYVLGGATKSIERATIGADGSLLPFEMVSSVLVTARTGGTASVVGDYLYLIGGNRGANAAAESVERAIINSDGSIGAFATVADVNAIPRTFHTTPMIGAYLYIVGGTDVGSSAFATRVDRAPIDFNGALGPFETITDVTSHVDAPSTIVVGPSLFALGSDTSVERAPIDAARTLGPFVSVEEVTLTTPRFAATTAELGNYVYVVGGANGRVPLNLVERAELK
jgi:N-acetylneuraminic acid mutarotase